MGHIIYTYKYYICNFFHPVRLLKIATLYPGNSKINFQCNETPITICNTTCLVYSLAKYSILNYYTIHINVSFKEERVLKKMLRSIAKGHLETNDDDDDDYYYYYYYYILYIIIVVTLRAIIGVGRSYL